ncbi:MAG: septum formation inhibitor Maf, partial [Flavobacteriaceae bacterium]
MKKLLLILFAITSGCSGPKSISSKSSSIALSQDFKQYWFDGTAEISSYTLDQSRYGQPRDGSAILIYVTEDFLPLEQVKANQKSEHTQSVLKLNRTKKFLTGIYPYSIMTSIFSRLGQSKPLVKTTTSIQEWCGQAYLQLNRRNNL